MTREQLDTILVELRAYDFDRTGFTFVLQCGHTFRGRWEYLDSKSGVIAVMQDGGTRPAFFAMEDVTAVYATGMTIPRS